MGLREYRRKRHFGRTPEPSGKKAPRTGGGLFVVQKHAATRLHYDFRLEMEGVLKSWAVPKGPSLDPSEKRLAVEVEDHPLEYGNFEGVIPEGEYGGGTVLLWDRGRWFPEGDPVEGLRKGHLKFQLEGEKLRGGWVLTRLGGGRGGDNGRNWLLIKLRDAEARTSSQGDILEERPESVASGRTLEEIAGGPHRVWSSKSGELAAGSGRKIARSATQSVASARKKSAASRQRTRQPSVHPPDPKRIPGARRAALPAVVEPELATLVDRPPPGDEWLHEIKYDGYRVLFRIQKGKVRIFTRRQQDWTERFPSLASEAARIRLRQAFLDGEIVALKPDGTSSFQDLQNSLSGGQDLALIYYAFDLLHLDGYDLRPAPIEERKRALADLLAASPGIGESIRLSEHVVGKGEEFHRQACRFALEGIISKRLGRPYVPGRARDWLKVKCLKRQEFVIGGYTEPLGSRVGLGSLLLGVNAPKKGLVYAGRVGTGFTRESLEELYRRLKKIERPTSPFAGPVPRRDARQVHWVEPKLVAEVEFTERTQDGILRHPSFRGLREDKVPAEVVWEEERKR